MSQESSVSAQQLCWQRHHIHRLCLPDIGIIYEKMHGTESFKICSPVSPAGQPPLQPPNFYSGLVKVKEACNGLLQDSFGVGQRVPGGLRSEISMTFGTWRWWGCQPHAPAAFTSRKCSWYSFSLGAESTPGPWYGQRNMSLKNSVTPPGIDPGTVWLVVQRLNHYATPGPRPCTIWK